MESNNISKQQCIEGLQKAANTLGKSPTISEYKQLDISPSNFTIIDRFGTWNNAKKEAGLDIYASPNEIYERPPPDNIDFNKDEWQDLSGYKRNKLRKRSIIAQEKISTGCSICGYDKHPAALDFHHTAEKSNSISSLVARGQSMEKIEEEIEKCIVLCSNCHRIKESAGYYDY